MNETEKLTLPISGKIVEIKGYLTGFIDQEIRKVLASANTARYEAGGEGLSGATGDKLPEGKMIMETNPGVQIDADNKRIELMVNTVAGEADNIVKRVLELPAGDVKAILDKIKTIEAASKVEATDPKVPATTPTPAA